MFRYFGLRSAYPEIVQAVEPVLYNGLIGLAVLAALVLIRRRLDRLGYSYRQQIILFLFTVFVAFPVGYLTSRAAGMFYQPMASWSLGLLVQHAFCGDSHTFHASILGPALILLLFFGIMRYNTAALMDTIFLYVPVGHAIGRVACLLIGCCWGNWIHLEFFGVYFTRVANPVPLYAILLNIAIFLVLRRIYESIYPATARTRRYGGSVAGAYLLLYGAVRISLEFFRVNRNILFGLTQAQIVMAAFILAGGGILGWVAWKYRRHSGQKTARDVDMARVLAAVGLVGLYLSVFAATFHLKRLNVLTWPFSPAADPGDAYMAIVHYMPFLVFPVLCLFWLRASAIPSRPDFGWSRFHPLFYAGLLCSIGYSAYLLGVAAPCLRGGVFWVPVVVLSLMNAVGEEFAFRQAFFRVFQRAGYANAWTNGCQGLLYATPHFVIGGASFGVLAFAYGVLLGGIRIQTRSVTPCMICHFFIDIGCIGLPMLSC